LWQSRYVGRHFSLGRWKRGSRREKLEETTARSLKIERSEGEEKSNSGDGVGWTKEIRNVLANLLTHGRNNKGGLKKDEEKGDDR